VLSLYPQEDARCAILQQLPSVAIAPADAIFCETLLWGVDHGAAAVSSHLLLSSATHIPG